MEYGEKKLIEDGTDDSEMVQNEDSQLPGPARKMTRRMPYASIIILYLRFH